MQDQGSSEGEYSVIIERALRRLAKANASVHALLIEKAEAGFFSEHQPKGKIDALAQEILLAVEKRGRD